MNSPAQILLVDDNPADLELTRDVLANSGRVGQVVTVLDGDEAIALLRGHGKYASRVPPAIILLDLNLPGRDGRAVLAEIKKDPDLRTTPVLIFTTSQAPHDIQHSYELGANCFISKPGNLHDFVTVVGALEEFWLKVARLPR